jgi:hypothetical protein
MLLRDQGDYAAARPLAERALELRTDVLGEKHPSIISSLNTLATLLRLQGDYAAARPLLERALALSTQGVGGEAPRDHLQPPQPRDAAPGPA